MKFKHGDLLQPTVILSDNFILVLECCSSSLRIADDWWYVVLNGEEITRWSAYYVERFYAKV